MRELAAKWERDAYEMDRITERNADLSSVEKRMALLQARVKRACAEELKRECVGG